MPHVYTTNSGFIPHSLRTDLPILIYIDDFIYSKSPYLKQTENNSSIQTENNLSIQTENNLSIQNFISKNKLKCFYGMKGRQTKTGNFILKKENGEFLFKKTQFGNFFKIHEIKEGILVDNLEILNEHIQSKSLLFIDLKGFIKPLEVIKFNKVTKVFEYTEVSEYLKLLYKNREINYFMQIVEITINEIENIFNQKLYVP